MQKTFIQTPLLRGVVTAVGVLAGSLIWRRGLSSSTDSAASLTSITFNGFVFSSSFGNCTSSFVWGRVGICGDLQANCCIGSIAKVHKHRKLEHSRLYVFRILLTIHSAVFSLSLLSRNLLCVRAVDSADVHALFDNATSLGM